MHHSSIWSGYMAQRQIKSRQRVADHGEVYTNAREVKAMCDLVKDECERIESRFLEPACGNGNFLAEILTRKLAIVTAKYGKSTAEWEKYSFLAVSSLYGVELLQDNTVECRERLFQKWNTEYEKICKSICSDEMDEMREAIRFILSRNILCGNALTLKQVDANANDTDTPIIFSEWAFIDSNNQIKRRDFRLDKLLKSNEETEKEKIQFSLFRDLDDMEYDKATKSWIPKPIREFELIDYKQIAHQKEIVHA